MSTTGAARVEAAMLPAPRASAVARRAPWPLVVVGIVVGVLFVGPLVYLLVRTLGFGDEALDVLASDDAIGPLLRTLLLAVTVSITCAVLGTTLGVARGPHRPSRAEGAAGGVRAPARDPVLRRCLRPQGGRRAAGPLRRALRARHGHHGRGLLGRVPRDHAPQLPVRVPARAGPALGAAARDRGVGACARPATGRGVPQHRAPADDRRDRGRHAADVPLLRERVRRRVAHAVRHADGAHRLDAPARPHDVDHAQPAARRRRDRGRRVRARAGAPADAARGARRRQARAARAPGQVAGARVRRRARRRAGRARRAGRGARRMGDPWPAGRVGSRDPTARSATS